MKYCRKHGLAFWEYCPTCRGEVQKEAKAVIRGTGAFKRLSFEPDIEEKLYVCPVHRIPFWADGDACPKCPELKFLKPIPPVNSTNRVVRKEALEVQAKI